MMQSSMMQRFASHCVLRVQNSSNATRPHQKYDSTQSSCMHTRKRDKHEAGGGGGGSMLVVALYLSHWSQERTRRNLLGMGLCVTSSQFSMACLQCWYVWIVESHSMAIREWSALFLYYMLYCMTLQINRVMIWLWILPPLDYAG